MTIFRQDFGLTLKQSNRSQDVDLFEILIPKDNDWDIMNELGCINCLHFVDLNKNEQPHHLRYFNVVRRSQSELEDICQHYKVPMKQPPGVDVFLQQVKHYTEERGKASHLLFNDIENDLQEKTKFIRQQQSGLNNMIKMYKNMLARANVLQQAQKIFKDQDDSELRRAYSDLGSPTVRRQELSSPLLSNQTKLVYLGGSIRQQELMSFKKLLFRATRGKVYSQFFNLNIDPVDMIDEVQSQKNSFVYLIMFEGGAYIQNKVEKICLNTQEAVFEIKREEVWKDLKSLEKQIQETREIIHTTKRQLRQYLYQINEMRGGEFSLIEIYKWFILKEKSIHIELNKLKDSQNILLGLFWCPRKLKAQLDERLEDIRSRRNINGPQIHQIRKFNDQVMIQPTYIETNNFTWPFQEIVNTYGVPAYKEVNPAVFATITFPFLFGVMFGDIFHGAILILFAAYLCYSQPKPNTALGQLAQIRYLLLLMGIFSFYCGFIYNDFTSIPLYIFGGSCYQNDFTTHYSELQPDCVYPVGVDPSWYLAKNELTYFNSLKMKLSVILGVAQMSLGIFMKALNSIYFKRTIDFTFEFLPQITLLLVLFGFMDLMIIVKWLTDFSQYDRAKPPSIITQMIVMCLGFGEQSDPKLQETPMFRNQTAIMRTLLIIAGICVPLMLLVKPIYENSKHKQHHKQTVVNDEEGRERQYVAINDNPEEDLGLGNDKSNTIEAFENKEQGSKTQHNFGDLFIHQLIETIEFVLGTVSNTASYLRLWALSLAHSQLAKVFFDNTLIGGLKSNSFVQLFLGYFVFLAFTVAVLMLMDLMEAFLHTLRLHWVEFQNKFYKGGGVKFNPFSIENVLKNANNRDTKRGIKTTQLQY